MDNIKDLKVGDRVRLSEFEGEPEQDGEILSIWLDDGMVVVCLDKEFRDDASDDGLRELGIEQIKNKI
jgi:hypothetical protein